MNITLGKINLKAQSDGGISLWPKPTKHSPQPVFCLDVSLLHNADARRNERKHGKAKVRSLYKHMQPRFTLKCWVWCVNGSYTPTSGYIKRSVPAAHFAHHRPLYFTQDTPRAGYFMLNSQTNISRILSGLVGSIPPVCHTQRPLEYNAFEDAKSQRSGGPFPTALPTPVSHGPRV
jgi:hypothetical protein